MRALPTPPASSSDERLRAALAGDRAHRDQRHQQHQEIGETPQQRNRDEIGDARRILESAEFRRELQERFEREQELPRHQRDDDRGEHPRERLHGEPPPFVARDQRGDAQAATAGALPAAMAMKISSSAEFSARNSSRPKPRSTIAAASALTRDAVAKAAIATDAHRRQSASPDATARAPASRPPSAAARRALEPRRRTRSAGEAAFVAQHAFVQDRDAIAAGDDIGQHVRRQHDRVIGAELAHELAQLAVPAPDRGPKPARRARSARARAAIACARPTRWRKPLDSAPIRRRRTSPSPQRSIARATAASATARRAHAGARRTRGIRPP